MAMTALHLNVTLQYRNLTKEEGLCSLSTNNCRMATLNRDLCNMVWFSVGANGEVTGGL